MSRRNHAAFPIHAREREQGFALFAVLMLLVILALAALTLTQSQRWAVRQTADRLDAMELNYLSLKQHDLCVQRVRGAIESLNGEILEGYSGQETWIAPNDARWSQPNARGCIYEWYGQQGNSGWTPQVRVSSRTQKGTEAIIEVSEWRYPACQGTACIQGGKVKNIDAKSSKQEWLNVQYGLGELLTTRQRL